MKQNKTFLLCATALFTALLCICSQLSIPIRPVPVNLAVFAVFVSGFLLPPEYAFTSGLAYLLLGGIGIPVFAGMQGGLSALVGPTGGYLIAYPVMAGLVSAMKKSSPVSHILAIVTALLVCYVLGTGYFSFSSGMPLSESIAMCVIPFIIPDLFKGIFAMWLSSVLKRRIKRFS